MITATGRELYYHTWKKLGSTHYYEVDFLISNGNKIAVFEVKSSGTGRHALYVFVSKRCEYGRSLAKEAGIFDTVSCSVNGSYLVFCASRCTVSTE